MSAGLRRPADIVVPARVDLHAAAAVDSGASLSLRGQFATPRG
ncbi:hypothetical protein R3Q17_30850 [Rhodococcus opacus]|nr:hypothetical protein [Rhodococcus opacus]